MGHPGFMTEKEWDSILDKMIYHLYYMDECNIDNEIMKQVPDNWIPTLRCTNEIMEKHKGEFFKLFSEYFYHLYS